MNSNDDEKNQRKRITELLNNKQRHISADLQPALTDLRKQRVKTRNQDKDPSVYAIEVTDMMFNFMEPRFEVPDQDELMHGLRVNA